MSTGSQVGNMLRGPQRYTAEGTGAQELARDPDNSEGDCQNICFLKSWDEKIRDRSRLKFWMMIDVVYVPKNFLVFVFEIYFLGVV